MNILKPKWLKIKIPKNYKNINFIQRSIKKNNLHSVCQESLCPNLMHCFNKGIATFMILGNICTRKCLFCNINKGKPDIVDFSEAKKLSKLIHKMNLKYVVITSVNRDDLKDGGAIFFSYCINTIRKKNKKIKVEILVPDFKNCKKKAVTIFTYNPPDIFNHNIESVERIHSKIKPGGNYKSSLNLLYMFKKKNPTVPTKSGIILGLGEKMKEILKTMHDLYDNGVSMLTIGQYLQPTKKHILVKKYITVEKFKILKRIGKEIGFTYIASGPFVRSSYNAELQFKGREIK
ncbi:lipoyl synthase [Candidatus Purcelliella pentastirinorum]|uniref:Lipoyl synthase n=1 Tax=Candidatus Purcelliella pentastirinorum TaxID=472834 RepID=A0AAX3NB12_9ENTR|nr:lipoyl synthase [Candidatus Purcelliella pentastirinorum]WDI78718.1 lipoyl synthase [Candidatus Purcelliella pentastirinorum]WDR80671.1 lipoyl synthase [Candidatus Purcelliella pentastirinorum]